MRDKSVKKKVYLLLGSVLALALLTEILFAHPHHHRLWNVVPGADILIGFGGAWLLILLGKGFMNKLLRRPENYYGAGGGQCGSKNGGVLACGKAPRKDFEAESRWQA